MERQYVGIDLHRRRSVIVRMDQDGENLATVRVDNDPVALGVALAEAGPDPEVALEATCGWYWAVDLLQASGARVHLVHPSGLDWAARRVKNDERDAPRSPTAFAATTCPRPGSPRRHCGSCAS